MNQSNFQFLQQDWPDAFASARKAEKNALQDPRASCFYARRGLEQLVHWLYKFDPALRVPYQDNLSALIHEQTFINQVGEIRFTKARLIKELGNQAVHSNKPLKKEDAATAVRELFHFSFWVARTYGRDGKPADGLTFDLQLLPMGPPVSPQTREKLLQYEAQLHERDEKLTELLNTKVALDEELKRLREEVAAAKVVNEATPDQHDYSEAETRDYFIDLLLREAGWLLDQPRDREYEVAGMPNTAGAGFVDYVLWGDDGKPLAVVEAKRTRRDARVGQQQAKLYADCLEQKFGQRPVIFYTNGYEHWMWDEHNYPPRAVQGFYTKPELELLIQRRNQRKSLAAAEINTDIVERYYQTRAIRRIGEVFEKDGARKALLVMATGSGKTRTVIALCDLLIRCNWAKRILFLADRTALVKQAVNAFKRHLPDSSPVNLVTERKQDGRIFVSTYPTMMNLIDEAKDGQRRFGVGYFDLIIVDEAHRSIYRKYKAIFDYFDSFLVGLTATPKDEVDRNTYNLFNLEDGVPTDSYDLELAVSDGFLVPSKAVSVPLRFQREGIKYKDLSEEEKELWDELDWNEEGTRPDAVASAEINKWLFNADTVDKVLEHLMTRGQHVAAGDRLGKTIMFAKNHDHAAFIAERFDVNYPNLKGKFARVIDFQTEYAQSLIDDFSNPAKPPHIAISVDMLDTGIDVPEVLNLVFFKLVRSKTKFWQMVGRGTRLSPDIFGPGQDKEFFYIFDWCQNLEFFSQDPETVEGSAGDSLGARLFKARVDLVGLLDAQNGQGVAGEEIQETSPNYGFRTDVVKLLHAEVASMRLDNFVVRPKRRLVEIYSKPEAWTKLGPQAVTELKQNVAGLPAELPPDDEEAKRFDLVMLNIQLGVLNGTPPEREIGNVRTIAGLLEELNIPIVQQQIILIQDIQTPEWWQDVTLPMLENARLKLRSLVKLIEKQKRKIVYTDFEDEIGEETSVELPGFAAPDSYEKFRAKARHFLMQHSDEGAIRKLRNNEPLTAADLAELEQILTASGIGGHENIGRAIQENHGLGLFVRSLVGLDREAAKKAFNSFISGKTLSGNQIEFVNLIIDNLTRNGAVHPEALYESPYIDINPAGPEGIFQDWQVIEIVGILEDIRSHAAA